MTDRTRVVVVTGASAGVGRASADAFAKTGASVALIARRSDRLDRAVKEIESLGAKALAVPADVADADAIEDAARVIEEELGPIDVWVNNAMVSVFAPLTEIDPGDFQRVTQVTYLGYVYGTMAALKRMVPRDSGSIIQVGSALAYRGVPLQSAYCGAKHAVQGFTESVRCELMHDKSGVRISMVQLPALNTPQFHWSKTSLKKHPQPVPPIYQPEVASRAIVWVADNYRREVSVAPTTAAAIVGDKVASGLLDRYLGLTGYNSQQSDRPIELGRPDNLWEPVTSELTAHGEFDDSARGDTLTWHWTTKRRWALPALALGALVVRRVRHRTGGGDA